jgi:hypothetical protein
VTRFDWVGHGVFIAGHPWGRVWVNRYTYVHPGYGPGVRRYEGARRAEAHQLIRRDEHERAAAREGRAREEEHHHDEHRPH